MYKGQLGCIWQAQELRTCLESELKGDYSTKQPESNDTVTTGQFVSLADGIK